MRKLVLVAALAASVLSVGRVALSDDTKKECCDEVREVKVPGFAKLKALVGDWKAKMGDKETHMSWGVTAAGTALIETHKMGGEGSMTTLYHADGDSLVLTHYCALGNQPRMKATKVTDTEIVFDFKDATNLKKDEPHMHALTIRFVDDKHVTEEWTFKGPEGEKKHVFNWERAK
jgi:hypothetical protein